MEADSRPILLLGKNGNLGSEFMRQLSGSPVVAWDREDLDVTDHNAVLHKITALGPRVIINCTAYNNVDEAEQSSAGALAINGYAPGYLAQAARTASALLVHFSTDYVFDGTSPHGYDESSVPHPLNAYGASKLLGEQGAAKYANEYYIVRTSWLFGKKGPAESAKPSFVDIMLELANTNTELKAVANEVSKPTYIPDLARATLGLIASKKSSGIYHIVNEGVASRFDWTKAIVTLAGLDVAVTGVPAAAFPRPAKRPEYGILINTKLLPLRSWQAALAEYLQSQNL